LAGVPADLTGSEQEDFLFRIVRYVFADVLDSGKGDGHGAAAQLGGILDGFGGLQCDIDEALEEGADEALALRKLCRLLYLSHDLVIAKDLGIEAAADK